MKATDVFNNIKLLPLDEHCATFFTCSEDRMCFSYVNNAGRETGNAVITKDLLSITRSIYNDVDFIDDNLVSVYETRHKIDDETMQEVIHFIHTFISGCYTDIKCWRITYNTIRIYLSELEYELPDPYIMISESFVETEKQYSMFVSDADNARRFIRRVTDRMES